MIHKAFFKIYKNVSISRAYLALFMTLTISFLLIFGTIWISTEYEYFNQRSEVLRNEFVATQNQLLQNQTKNCLDYIEFQKSQTEKRLKERIKGYVYQAHAIATQIYQTHKNHLPDSEIKKRILEAISPIRFNIGKGYIFINSLDGKGILYPLTPQNEGKNLLKMKDTNGNAVIQSEIDIVKTQGEGFSNYSRHKDAPNPYNVYSKISFVKKFEPYDWYFGTKAYIDDFREEIQKETLRWLQKFRFDSDGYLFVYHINGECLAHRDTSSIGLNYREYKNSQRTQNIEQMLTLAKEKGAGFITYPLIDSQKGTKTSHIQYIKDWDWVVGAGIFTNSIDESIAQKRAILKQKVKAYIIGIIILILVAIVILYFTARLIAKKMQQSIDSFQSFFKRAATQSDKIHSSQVYFSEFKNLARTVNYMIDVRTQKENDLLVARKKAEESDRLKSAFLSNMSHEIRTPMNAVIGFSELLLQEDLSIQTQRQFLDYIRTSSKSLLNLINDIIDVSKIESGEIKISLTQCNVNDLITKLHLFFTEDKKQRNKSNVLLKKELGLADSKAQITTDPYRLNQILTNLVDNALKFTSEGEILVGYTLEVDEKLKFYVKDTGIGIDAEKQKIIFNRFRQADDSHTRKFGGTGLGLTISKNLAELLGGEIWVESTPEKGSCFYFTIPYKCTLSKYHKKTGSITSNSLDLTGKKILIVDDIPNNLFILQGMLRYTGAEIITSESGADALYLSQNHQFDMVLLDLQMPVMNGHETLIQLRKAHPNLKIIAQTAYALANEKEEILASGFDGYIPKPILQEELLETIANLLN